MSDINVLAVAVAAVAAFILSALWYGVFGRQLAELDDAYAEPGRMPAWKVAVELVRSLVVATVLAWLAVTIDITEWTGAVGLGLVLWVGFPVVLLTGSVIHENVPWKLAAIHAGDWLLKLVVIAVIVGLWR
ncbi:MAG TPA: DUF1761 domain-containing protein [Jiangellaceae bacterium]|nr:DUF1761 domain-containing protein [Jiangellaceae bacterium]